MFRPTTRCALVGVVSLALLEGCSAWVHATAGVATTFSGGRDGPEGVVDLEYGGSIGRDVPIGPSLNLHGRFGDQLVQLAPSLSLRAMARAPAAPFVGLGVRAFSFESNNGSFGFGMGSPYLDAGIYVPFTSMSSVFGSRSDSAGGGLGVVLHGQVGYDVRFTSQPNETWASISLGIGMFSYAR